MTDQTKGPDEITAGSTEQTEHSPSSHPVIAPSVPGEHVPLASHGTANPDQSLHKDSMVDALLEEYRERSEQGDDQRAGQVEEQLRLRGFDTEGNRLDNINQAELAQAKRLQADRPVEREDSMVAALREEHRGLQQRADGELDDGRKRQLEDRMRQVKDQLDHRGASLEEHNEAAQKRGQDAEDQRGTDNPTGPSTVKPATDPPKSAGTKQGRQQTTRKN